MNAIKYLTGNFVNKSDMLFKILGVLFLMLFPFRSIAQTSEPVANETPLARHASISVIARVDVDSVVLRWAPSTAGGWVIANRIGYQVERVTVSENVPFDAADYIKLNTAPIKPLSLEDWAKVPNPENPFYAIAAQALYGNRFIPRALDGGDLNVLRNAADELSNRYSFSLFAADNDMETANALGLRWVDKDVKPGDTYVYRVFLTAHNEDYSFDTAYVVVHVVPFVKDPAPTGLHFESGDGQIKLSWEESEINSFSGYYVYRSDGTTPHFEKLTKTPLISITPIGAEQEARPGYTDTTTVNYKRYSYRVVGVSPFGELSEPAEITAYSKDLSPPPPPLINKPEQVSGREVKISWEMRDPPADFQGFVVSRSTHSLYGYELITPNPLPAYAREFTDNMMRLEEAYYIVGSVDTTGNIAFSHPVLAIVIDTVPPLPPTGLAGLIDESGVVNLSWNLGQDAGLIGYRVLRANHPSHEFSQLTGQILADTVFRDSISINTLTRNVYYRVAAVNRRHQHSELSPVLALKRPDIIPPAEAVFSDVLVTDNSVYLQWHRSPSEDLAIQILMRKKQNDGTWEAIDSLPPAISSFIDNNVQKNIVYEYTIVSVDNSGLSSEPALAVVARPYDTGRRNPVENFTATYLPNDNAVALSWNYSAEPAEKYWFVIYKAMGDNILTQYKSVESTAKVFTDKQVTNATYHYGIAVMTSLGGESAIVTTSIIVGTP